ncbi:uncharacterized protein E0L32_006773 [Thyridium curvatum]|uniref:Phospholipid/glycerol acyltransferase domain-containing protein n=1 Tax=Thyridium curvatum TaxID=1093900 RepID=A0A507AZ34_9PEZI|nr:uncharacterized protein E0L32_006773 [Thyridium curvatum]TPX12893.1 hypothetical protein E0L32_006773 [Thyridium curvatum]
MASGDLRQRTKPAPTDNGDPPAANLNAGTTTLTDPKVAHPSGKRKHGRLIRWFRGFSFAVYFLSSCIAINLTQIVGAPLYWLNRDLYYAYMALTKQSFGLLITSMTYWWGPTTIRISGDDSVAGQIKRTADGRVEFAFPERLVLIANHQIYTDWLYLWWVGYANSPQMHGYLYIILKESLKYIPVIGTGMMFYGFIFMSRKMAVDQPRMAHRLGKLKTRHTAPDGRSYLNPMWLLLFPEGTNLSNNGRAKSARWAEKSGLVDMQHLLLPRSTGMYFCLSELKDTVEYVYDCTVAYEGVPRGGYGEEYFGLSSTYFEGRAPKSVNFHWRRFRIADIPLSDAKEFELWLRERWYEKDALMEEYLATGRFPASPEAIVDSKGLQGRTGAYVETEVRTRYPFEFVQIFVVLGVFGLVWNVLGKMWANTVGVFR